jgi:protein involved in polysaccharide export with SLBB domain
MILIVKSNYIKKMASFILIAAFLGPLSCSRCLAQEYFKKEVRVGPGDAIRLYVYDGVSATDKTKFISNFHDMEFIVDGMGDIQLFSLGNVHIAGQTTDEITGLLREKFKLFTKDPYVVVIPLVRISLRGGFNQPGMYRFSLDKSFWDVLKEAGGLNGLSTIDDLYVLRKDIILYRDFSEALYKASSLSELGLESGDEIVAPRVNRMTFESILRYFQFGMTILTFYLSIQTYNNNK